MTTRPLSRDRAMIGLRGTTTALALASVTATAAIAGLMARQTESSVQPPAVTTVGAAADARQPSGLAPRKVVVVVHAPPGRPMNRGATMTVLKRFSATSAASSPRNPTVTAAPPAAVPAGTSSGSDPA